MHPRAKRTRERGWPRDCAGGGRRVPKDSLHGFEFALRLRTCGVDGLLPYTPPGLDFASGVLRQAPTTAGDVHAATTTPLADVDAARPASSCEQRFFFDVDGRRFGSSTSCAAIDCRAKDVNDRSMSHRWHFNCPAPSQRSALSEGAACRFRPTWSRSTRIPLVLSWLILPLANECCRLRQGPDQSAEQGDLVRTPRRLSNALRTARLPHFFEHASTLTMSERTRSVTI